MNTRFVRMVHQFRSEIFRVPKMVKNYEEAINALNGLQSNAAVIEKSRLDRDKRYRSNIPLTCMYSERAGVKLEDLDKLSIIHVSGTKGKGSTCAYCESLLRAQGYKTGFFSSPHLVEVRERVRINGQPLGKDMFSKYFWDCYNRLLDNMEREGDMPAYFKFLTIMAFKVFLLEKVDVAIIEVGIGGQYDCTNIIRTPVVCGITSLGMDHMGILGNTLEKIAWQKAGIMKPGCPTITVPQPGNCLQVIKDRAKELQSHMQLAPDITDYNWGGREIKLGIAGEIQHTNAALALKLCQIWQDRQGGRQPYAGSDSELKMSSSGIPVASAFDITDVHSIGLRQCCWPGRTQTIKRKSVTYYLDGAHTPRSIEHCVKWFMEEADKEKQELGNGVIRIMLFNSTGDRVPESLLEPLIGCDIDCAVFCPNIVALSSDCADNTNMNVTTDSQFLRCRKNKDSWLKLCIERDISKRSRTEEQNDELVQPKLKKLKSSLANGDSTDIDKDDSVINKIERDIDTKPCDHLHNGLTNGGLGDTLKSGIPQKVLPPTYIFHTISEALQFITQGKDKIVTKTTEAGRASPHSDRMDLHAHLENPKHIQVLVTGSLHLVGGTLSLVDPHINDSDEYFE